MKSHFSTIFEFDKQKTEKGYKGFTTVLCLPNETWRKCLALVKEMCLRQKLDLGIDFLKPWEEIEMEDYYQIEYLFVGRFLNSGKHSITDQTLGVNFFSENRFGRLEFENNELLNLTLIINKTDANNS